MTISIRLNDKEEKLIKTYARKNNISISELIRKTLIEKIENEYDLECYEKAIKEYKQNKKTYSLEEVKRIIKNK